MHFLNIGDILNSTINPRHPEYCCSVTDLNLGVLSYGEFKTGKDLWSIKKKCARNSQLACETLAVLWSHQDSPLVSLDNPGIETEWSGITNMIKALDFTV